MYQSWLGCRFEIHTRLPPKVPQPQPAGRAVVRDDHVVGPRRETLERRQLEQRTTARAVVGRQPVVDEPGLQPDLTPAPGTGVHGRLPQLEVLDEDRRRVERLPALDEQRLPGRDALADEPRQVRALGGGVLEDVAGLRIVHVDGPEAPAHRVRERCAFARTQPGRIREPDQLDAVVGRRSKAAVRVVGLRHRGPGRSGSGARRARCRRGPSVPPRRAPARWPDGPKRGRARSRSGRRASRSGRPRPARCGSGRAGRPAGAGRVDCTRKRAR